MSKILAVCKNPGGTAGVIPVVKILRRRGCQVTLVANGKAIELLTAAHEDFVACATADEALTQCPAPDALITSMCSSGGVGFELARRWHGLVPIFALQDFWGGALKTVWTGPTDRPDYICVNDEVGAAIVQKAWPEFQTDHILITGYPALDKYVHYDTAATARAVHETLTIDQSLPIVLFAGQLEGTGHVLTEVVAALNDLRLDVYFIPRLHLRMKDDAPQELPACQAALDNFSGRLIANSSACDTQSLIASAQVVISAYSTALVEAAVLGKENISVLYPEVGMAIFQQGTGGIMNEFPLVTLGCSAKATSREELTALLKQSFTSGLGLRPAQERHFRLDGQNASRVAEQIEQLV